MGDFAYTYFGDFKYDFLKEIPWGGLESLWMPGTYVCLSTWNIPLIPNY